MAAQARLKNEYKEDEKYHNLMDGSNVFLFISVASIIGSSDIVLQM